MKYNVKITAILLLMFVVTQLIGLYVLNADPFNIKTQVDGNQISTPNPVLSWVRPPEIQEESDFSFYFGSIISSFIFAVLLFFLLTKFKVDLVMRIWVFLVVGMSLSISLIAFFPRYIYLQIGLIAVAIALSFIKVFKGNFIIHNLTELLIYPGIATIFVPMLNLWSACLLLVLISIYDMWAVWHVGIMQKMARYQIDKLKIFSGFFIPYISKKDRLRLKELRRLKKKNKGIKANIAILGGGDVTFPLIAVGVVLKTQLISLPFGLFPNFVFVGGIIPALFVIAGATIGLGLLINYSDKKKSYPAMPFISTGVFVSLVIYSLIFH